MNPLASAQSEAGRTASDPRPHSCTRRSVRRRQHLAARTGREPAALHVCGTSRGRRPSPLAVGILRRWSMEGDSVSGTDCADPLGARKLLETARRGDACLGEQGVREPRRKMPPQKRRRSSASVSKKVVPRIGLEFGPLNEQLLSLPARKPRSHGEVGEVEQSRSGPAAMREEKSAARDCARAGRLDPHAQRDSRQRSMRVRRGDERRQGGIGLVDRVSEAPRDRSPAPSLPVAGTESPPREDDGRGVRLARPVSPVGAYPAFRVLSRIESSEARPRTARPHRGGARAQRVRREPHGRC